jgi:hypothetical protein
MYRYPKHLQIAGILKNATPRPPTIGPSQAETDEIRTAVQNAGCFILAHHVG